MNRRRNQGARVSLLGGACLLLACNEVLGIEAPPKNGQLTPSNDPNLADDGGVSDGNLNSEEDDKTPVVSEEPPSPYAWANWPMPNPSSLNGLPNPQTFGVRSAGVVFDSATKLEWQQSADKKARTRDEAEEYCASLSLGGGNFRLPARIELLSIVDFTQANPAFDPKAFPGAEPGRYWSASRYAGGADRGWLVNFEFGTGLVFIETADKPFFVRCVR